MVSSLSRDGLNLAYIGLAIEEKITENARRTPEEVHRFIPLSSSSNTKTEPGAITLRSEEATTGGFEDNEGVSSGLNPS